MKVNDSADKEVRVTCKQDEDGPMEVILVRESRVGSSLRLRNTVV